MKTDNGQIRKFDPLVKLEQKCLKILRSTFYMYSENINCMGWIVKILSDSFCDKSSKTLGLTACQTKEAASLNELFVLFPPKALYLPSQYCNNIEVSDSYLTASPSRLSITSTQDLFISSQQLTPVLNFIFSINSWHKVCSPWFLSPPAPN